MSALVRAAAPMSALRPVSAKVVPDYHGRVRTEIAPLLTGRGGRLLDFGGGIGATALWARAEGYADLVGVADRVAPAGGLDFARTGDLEEPGFLRDTIMAEGPFRTILCLDILEHLRDPWSVVAALHGGLEPGGAIVASIPNVRHYSALAPLLFHGRWELSDAGILDRTHLRFFTRASAIGLMTSSGLRLDAVRARPSGGRRIRLIRALTCGLGKSFTDLQYLIRVTRPGRTPESEDT